MNEKEKYIEMQIQLLKSCIERLPEEVLFRELDRLLTKEQKSELSDIWFNLYAAR